MYNANKDDSRRPSLQSNFVIQTKFETDRFRLEIITVIITSDVKV
ncbi:MAG TPA: hypothetical protein PK431_05455 [Chitinophagales bacterium]|nr:hypothetical protein [Chitinophagales bacterium]